MKKHVLLIIIFAILMLTVAGYAEEQFAVSPENATEERGGKVLPERLKGAEQNAGEIVDIKNALETANSGILKVEYNKDGTINSILYSNGILAQYSYEKNEGGDITKIGIFVGGVIMRVCDVDKDTVLVELYLHYPTQKASLADGKSANSPIAVSCPKKDIDLNKVATTPVKFDFEEIKKAIAEASKLKEDAMREYEKNTASYYEKVENKLKDSLKEFAAEGIAISAFLKALDKKNINTSERRVAIDEAVQHIIAGSDPGNKREAVHEFINLEKTLRGNILNPAREIYDGEMNVALEYVNSMIDKLLRSKLALYMNKNKEKIDIIINLPKPSKNDPR